MKTDQLNLFILDDNSLIAGPLSKYLNNRFGSRVNLSIFIDSDECIRKIDHNSHILILNYAMNGEDKGAYQRGEVFRNIRKLNPNTEVTMLTSKQGVFDATTEMEKNVSDYIRRKERYRYDGLRMLETVVFAPIRTHIIIPVKKWIKDYTIIHYVAIILGSFVSVGIVVIAALELIRYFGIK